MNKTDEAMRRTESRIPAFKTIEEEAEFWDTHDSSEFDDEFETVTDVRFVRSKAQTADHGALGSGHGCCLEAASPPAGHWDLHVGTAVDYGARP